MLQSALSAAVERRPLHALSEEELFVSAGADVARRIKSCGPELDCICSAAASLPVDLLFVLLASFDREPSVIGLRLIDKRGCRIASQAIAEPSRAEDLSRVVERLANDVLEKVGYARYGRVRFEVSPADAVIVPEDDMSPEPGDAKSFKSKPGAYRVAVSAPGYVSRTVDFSLASDRETNVRVELEPESSIVESPWFWTAVGFVAAAVAAGTIIYLNRPESVCVPPAGAACDER